MIVLGDLNLLTNGTVHMIAPTITMYSSKSKIVKGETLTKVIGSPDNTLMILGHFSDTSAGIADWKILRSMILSGNIFILKQSKIDNSDPIYFFTRLLARPTEFPAGHTLYYSIDCVDVPAWGRTTIHTGSSVHLLDLDYFRWYDELLSPIWHDCNWYIDQTNKIFGYDFYLRNDLSTSQDAILEIQAPNTLPTVKVYYSNGSTWTLIGDWGGADSWGATKNFTDPLGIAHNVILSCVSRGGTLSGIGTASLRLGCNNRILMKITSLSGNDVGGADSKTKYGKDQLLLRMRVAYSDNTTDWID